MTYRFTPEAREDVHDAADYYERQRQGLGAEFAVEVGIGIARVLDAPNRWPEVESGIRKYRLDRFPYGHLLPSPEHSDYRNRRRVRPASPARWLATSPAVTPACCFKF